MAPKAQEPAESREILVAAAAGGSAAGAGQIRGAGIRGEIQSQGRSDPPRGRGAEIRPSLAPKAQEPAESRKVLVAATAGGSAAEVVPVKVVEDATASS
ncbi:MAG: hypothetical protein KJO11_08390 [Gemmatimonadetes bacterium]|nr:hypothetical protein [Gemmatimonadota bacterium]